GLVTAASTGVWRLQQLYDWLYYPLALTVVAATVLDYTPRARRSTRHEGAERAWFYIAVWAIVPTQVVGWAVWSLGSALKLTAIDLARMRLAVFLGVSITIFLLGLKGRLPRTERYRASSERTVDSGPSLDLMPPAGGKD